MLFIERTNRYMTPHYQQVFPVSMEQCQYRTVDVRLNCKQFVLVKARRLFLQLLPQNPYQHHKTSNRLFQIGDRCFLLNVHYKTVTLPRKYTSGIGIWSVNQVISKRATELLCILRSKLYSNLQSTLAMCQMMKVSYLQYGI